MGLNTHLQGHIAITSSDGVIKVYQSGRLMQIIDQRTGGGVIYL